MNPEVLPAHPRYYWTKVWGLPTMPAAEGLMFNSPGVRDRAAEILRAGDIVVFLASESAQSDPLVRGFVSGIVEIEGNLVTAEELGLPERARQEDFKEDGRYRWPWGISVSRVWHVTDREGNDTLVPEHRETGIRGAVTVHPMAPASVARLQKLRATEIVNGRPSDPLPFVTCLRKTFFQKEHGRIGTNVTPGSEVYVAVIIDSNGLTFKVGSGKTDDRLEQLNLYRRPSQGEMLWSILMRMDLGDVSMARKAEDQILAAAASRGQISPDHSEFVVGMTMEELKAVFAAAIDSAIDGPKVIGAAE